MEQRKNIADVFDIQGTYIGEYPYGNGHINDTFGAIYENNGKKSVILGSASTKIFSGIFQS